MITLFEYFLPGHGMEWKIEWNGTAILVWNMEDTRMEWNNKINQLEKMLIEQIIELESRVLGPWSYIDS